MEKIKTILASICLGQILSLFICGTAVSSEYLASTFHVNIPLGQNFLHYFLLFLVYGISAVLRLAKNINESIKLSKNCSNPQNFQPYSLYKFFFQRGWKYVIAALMDVEANYCIVMAYQYTSVTSVQLLDCITIPTTLILSLIFFKIRYAFTHYFGVGLCLLGIAAMIAGDFFTQKASFEAFNPLLGNILVVFGSILYGCSNVWQEHLIREYSIRDYLGFMSIAATLITGIQSLCLEMSNLLLVPSQANAYGSLLWLCLITYSFSMFCFYSLVPIVLQRSSAVLVNLSLTTADIYALLAGLILFHYKFHWIYFVGYVSIVLGVVVYVSKLPQPRELPPPQQVYNDDIEEVHSF